MPHKTKLRAGHGNEDVKYELRQPRSLSLPKQRRTDGVIYQNGAKARQLILEQHEQEGGFGAEVRKPDLQNNGSTMLTSVFKLDRYRRFHEQ